MHMHCRLSLLFTDGLRINQSVNQSSAAYNIYTCITSKYIWGRYYIFIQSGTKSKLFIITI